ncbi:MAG TPA: hypothetical protein VNJ28_05285 [Candidatus Limnocylindrales bacterium]|nr:hypothetical protein [Candidatus Limnocylindrales bacterium]
MARSSPAQRRDPAVGSGRRSRRLLLAGTVAVLGLLSIGPAIVLGHPLGNFTINHYAGLRIGRDAVVVDAVIDRAEIPAFEERRRIDTDGDGRVSGPEATAARRTACRELAASLELVVAGRSLALEPTAAGLSFPPGAGGLPTMRLVCIYRAGLADPIAAPTEVRFADRSFSARIGWREIVVEGDGVTVEGEGIAGESASSRLTSYPTDLLSQPLAVSSVTFTVRPGGLPLPPLAVPDATPLAPGTALDGRPLEGQSGAAGEGGPVAAAGAAETAPRAGPPGGTRPGELPPIFSTRELSPLVALAAVLSAIALGAGHALTPGHGKTVIAAYLVGTRGTLAQAAGLGLVVSVSHSLGILALGGLIVAAERILPADVVVRTAPLVAAIAVVGVGGWMVWTAIRRIRRGSPAGDRNGHGHGHEHDLHGHEHDLHGHEHDHLHGHEHDLHGHEQPHGHEHGHPNGHEHAHRLPPEGELGWRSLFTLGLAGGLVPSTSALLILLGAVAAGQPAYGILLVAAFAVGMAAVMVGLGIGLVVARSWLEPVARRRHPDGLGARLLERADRFAPLVAGVVVVSIGLVLAGQAIVAVGTL